ncbi:conserved hypothetical protein [Desulfamplus magnetovallimortis]|uniref:tRNA threonylcarbamoyladenosine biosynthesis protein TsaE n=1 Tax=Desulfamplus magnetovallimortis TaxID=1246637 RepID=A0A1W1H5I0_9BACT|nr:tRNA (adenosine(37)-N6)-threonylcarbamoyltransferase complex ATPase subunit type 1 TsaE [Desulfamplus magnetovallimortis]SLM27740.1 conserved hypothetical protein [Desulfamplus magnetovallimortis]
MEIKFYSKSAVQTQKIAEKLASTINGKLAIALYGDLGAGKTTFVQGFANGLDVPEGYYITSPTYNIINEYPGRLPLYHMDLYRLGSSDELEYIGLDDIVASEGVIIVEWPELMEHGIIQFDLSIKLVTDNLYNREISFIASGLEGVNLLRNFSV